MKIGYIRVSRDKQTTALQEDAMNNERCERVFMDKMSGKRFDRPEFLKMLAMAPIFSNIRKSKKRNTYDYRTEIGESP